MWACGHSNFETVGRQFLSLHAIPYEMSSALENGRVGYGFSRSVLRSCSLDYEGLLSATVENVGSQFLSLRQSFMKSLNN
jgi:hypothetical protein